MKTTEYLKARWELWQKGKPEHANIEYKQDAQMAELLERAHLLLYSAPQKDEIIQWREDFSKFQEQRFTFCILWGGE